MSFHTSFDPKDVELPPAGKTSLGLPCECDCHRISNTFHCVPCCAQQRRRPKIVIRANSDKDGI